MSEQTGVTQAAYSMYESGKSTPSGAVINSICKVFNVREEWLRTGEGEMFNPPPQDPYEALAREVGLDPEFKTVLELFARLPEPMRKTVIEYAVMMCKCHIEYLRDTGQLKDSPKDDTTNL